MLLWRIVCLFLFKSLDILKSSHNLFNFLLLVQKKVAKKKTSILFLRNFCPLPTSFAKDKTGLPTPRRCAPESRGLAAPYSAGKGY